MKVADANFSASCCLGSDGNASTSVPVEHLAPQESELQRRLDVEVEIFLAAWGLSYNLVEESSGKCRKSSIFTSSVVFSFVTYFILFFFKIM